MQFLSVERLKKVACYSDKSSLIAKKIIIFIDTLASLPEATHGVPTEGNGQLVSFRGKIYVKYIKFRKGNIPVKAKYVFNDKHNGPTYQPQHGIE